MKASKFFDFHIYPVITEKFCKNKSSINTLKQVLQSDVKIVQLREKDLSKKELIELAYIYRELTAEKDVKLIINDHVDIALLVKADGVHLGQDDFPCEEARKIAPKLVIGISTHNVKEAVQAQKDGADYINIGPVFSTNTKQKHIKNLGIAEMKKIASKIKIPYTVMGGIKNNNLHPVLNAGAKRIAMVTEITMAYNIKTKINHLRELIINHS